MSLRIRKFKFLASSYHPEAGDGVEEIDQRGLQIGECGFRMAEDRGQRKAKEWETNPIELTCLLSMAYTKNGRDKPQGDMSRFFNNLEQN